MLAVAVVDPHFPLCGVCAGKYIQLISVVISTAGPAKIDTHYSYRYWGTHSFIDTCGVLGVIRPVH